MRHFGHEVALTLISAPFCPLLPPSPPPSLFHSTAHIHDAVALCEFLRWLEQRLEQPGTLHELTEVAVADQLEAFRREQPDFVSLSFDTISSIGGNGAIVHYKPGM